MLNKTIAAIVASLCVLFSMNSYGYTIFSGVDEDGSLHTRASFTNATAAETSFLSHLQGVGTETFENVSGNAPFNLSFLGAGTATLSGSASIQVQGAGVNGLAQYPHSGTHFVQTDSTNFVITFGSSVAAFGFFGIDIGEFGGDLRIRVTRAVGGTVDIDVPNASLGHDGSDLYFGLIAQNAAEEILSVQFFDANAALEQFAFDDMTIGSTPQVCQSGCNVPEPDSMLLLGFGAIILLGATRLKRPQSI